ncbi:MAG TPA: TGS domain-containing protein, partial [Candidatus Defluviicoccus seviourii]|nr:TGS domain-containing protein [Candidatus Defluviicoccus seviourii]
MARVRISAEDGRQRTYASGTSGLEIARDLSADGGAGALALRVNGELRDLSRPLTEDAEIAVITAADADALELIRHDAAHMMAQAVQELFPGTQVTIGPAIENGFYYDFARDEPFTPADLATIEARMREIVARDEPIRREEWERTEAIAYFRSIGEHYKAEIVADIPEGQPITIYRQGNWLDLCRGPHLASTGRLGTAFKLTKVAGAYWRGDSRNPMLQ